MRSDAIGLFWEDIPTPKGKKAEVIREMPPIPDTGWKAPTELPDLSRCKAIAIDTETYDPDLIKHGPGWGRGVGHIVGISIAVPEGGQWYFPIRHEVEKEDNLDPDKVLAWLSKTLSNPKQPKIGANLTYDVGWLIHEGVEIKGSLYDVQFAEALLQEDSRLELEVVGNKYLGEGKVSNQLYEWCSLFYGGKVNGSQRKNIYRTPPRLAGPYAISDVDLPLRILNKQWPLLHKEGLFQLFEMECKLIYLMVEMRRQGVTVDVDKAEQLKEDLTKREILIGKQIKDMVGFEVNINSNPSLSKAFRKLGIKTIQGGKTNNDVFQKEWLENHGHPLAQLIVERRKMLKLRGTFVDSYILDSHIDGKVYGSFHQLNTEGGGTRSGRFSSSNPNLQNIPSRDEELAPLIRGLFIPDEGHRYWRKYDYSQIEYRLLIHYAIGEGADETRDRFIDNPNIDYHDFALNLISPVAGWDISSKAKFKARRKPIKTVNFGLIYGMGVKVFAQRLNISVKEAKELVETYFRAIPFAKPTMDGAMMEAQESGIITTILGRKSRFDQWEPTDRSGGRALSYEEARMCYGDIRRAFTHKALNRRLQGSSADLMKVAMLKCYEDGVFDVTGVPKLTVHDELDFSDHGNSVEAYKEMQHIMQTAIPLKIPVIADGEIGYDWGHVVDLDKFDYALG